MAIEILVGLILGFLFVPIGDYVQEAFLRASKFDWVWTLAILIFAIVILHYLGLLNIYFMVSFVLGLFFYKWYIDWRW